MPLNDGEYPLATELEEEDDDDAEEFPERAASREIFDWRLVTDSDNPPADS